MAKESNLGGVEKKVLGALLILANEDMVARASLTVIAKHMGYKRPGGALTFALKMLEMKNLIAPMGECEYKVLL